MKYPIFSQSQSDSVLPLGRSRIPTRSPLLQKKAERSQGHVPQAAIAQSTHCFSKLALHTPELSAQLPIQRQTESEEHARIAQPPVRSPQTGLPDRLKLGIESLSGMAMDDVRVHYNSSQPAQVQALAYTQGSHIHIAPGQEHHLPHEAWHVVQQAQGRVQPTLRFGGMPINDSQALEHEADVMGTRAINGSALPQIAPSPQALFPAGGVVQKKDKFIGDPSRHHMHIGISQPHYKNGNSKGSRIEIGHYEEYSKEALEQVIDVVKTRRSESGAQDCYDWCLAEARSIKAASKL